MQKYVETLDTLLHPQQERTSENEIGVGLLRVDARVK